MKNKIEQRLAALKAEFESGQKMLRELEAKQANLKQTVLRISGAIQVLEELLEETEAEATAEEPEPEKDGVIASTL